LPVVARGIGHGGQPESVALTFAAADNDTHASVLVHQAAHNGRKSRSRHGWWRPDFVEVLLGTRFNSCVSESIDRDKTPKVRADGLRAQHCNGK
jgi:hypothetical protein